jgi:excinuclease ABC subunit C
MPITPGEVFTEFGPSAFLRKRPADSIAISRDRREVRRQLRATCPALPGVYGMIDHAGRLIYVGVSRCLRHRVLSYFQGKDTFERHSRREDGPRKELRIARRAVQLVWEVAGHELLALLREHELIRRFAPDLNVRGRRRRRLAYLYLSTEEAPRFRIAGKLPKSCRHHWGPFAQNRHLIRSVELLNRHFKLPDCPSDTSVRFADDQLLFPIVDRPLCLRGDVGSCLAPCVAGSTRRAYHAQLSRARDFLNGDDETPLAELDRALAVAVERRQFEHAARLHDIRTDLEMLRDRLLPRPHEEPRSFIYPIARRRRTTWLLIQAGTVLAVRNQPATATAAKRWLDQLEGLGESQPCPIDDRDAGETRIVSAWFRSNPTEIDRVLSYAAAKAICRQICRAS